MYKPIFFYYAFILRGLEVLGRGVVPSREAPSLWSVEIETLTKKFILTSENLHTLIFGNFVVIWQFFLFKHFLLQILPFLTHYFKCSWSQNISTTRSTYNRIYKVFKRSRYWTFWPNLFINTVALQSLNAIKGDKHVLSNGHFLSMFLFKLFPLNYHTFF